MDTKEKLREQIHDTLYWEMCRDCPRAKYCHEECEECDDFVNELYRQYKKYGVNEDYEEPEEEELPSGWKSYKDNKGRLYFYKTIDMLCEMISCKISDCPNWAKCTRNKEQNSCNEYNKTLKELKAKGIE